jgi:3-hydroxymyristoyl/3-hydroxydecanoyl-(acyl carrier protein) dehydratase
VALVLKRLDDARHDGDRIYAVIAEVATGSRIDENVRSNGHGQEIESIEASLGSAGAATGLATVAKAALCLDSKILPSTGPSDGPRFWMRNRSEGARRARVSATSLGGHHGRVGLEEFDHDRAKSPLSSRSPRRQCALFAMEADDRSGLLDQITELGEMCQTSSPPDIDRLARQWWQRHPNNPRLKLGTAFVVDGVPSLVRRLGVARRDLDREAFVSFAPNRVAFVYPGLGNQFAGMGQGLSVLWPEVVDAEDHENGQLLDQFDPRVWWRTQLPRTFTDHRDPILGSVSLGAFVTDILRSLGVTPDAAIGYSLGESAAMVALRSWTERDLLLRRLTDSPLFKTELAGPCDAARRLWNIPPHESVEWVAGIVPRPAEVVRTIINGLERVYILIKNTADETVIGGQRKAVDDVVKKLGCPFIELPTVSTVHCEVGRTVFAEYRALHDLETTPISGVDFYSGATGRTYHVDRSTAADAITAQAVQTIDFPALVEQAFEDGIRVFVEVGPGASCTRLVSHILRGHEHRACSACRPDRDPLGGILDVLATLISSRVPVDLGRLYREPAEEGGQSLPDTVAGDDPRARKIRVAVRAKTFEVPAIPIRRTGPLSMAGQEMPTKYDERAMALTSPAKSPVEVSSDTPRSYLVRSVFDAQRATGEAHEAFLRVAHQCAELLGKQLAYQFKLIETGKNGRDHGSESFDRTTDVSRAPDFPRIDPEPVWLDRSQCLEFAIGSIGAVMGPEFAEIDGFPTRVRLPDEPLMLVDRILSIEGHPRSLQTGRVVTEHDIEPAAWYLDGGRIAPAIAIEAGQADLLLCAYLGIDFETKGLAVYRLLDATVTFHRGLPVAGEVIRYDIKISKFFRQGQTILFRFLFDASVGGEPLMSMRDGCAGFFTTAELAAGKGIVPRSVDLPTRRRFAATEIEDVIPVAPTRLDASEVDALRRGDLATAFGAPFDRVVLDDPLTLPGNRMSLIHRVTDLDPAGGPAGLGSIRAEADIRPGDWFIVCHFIDDRVMPGTLMYECCLHALRIFMMRLGWVGKRGQAAFEPVPGIENRLKCRGQIVETSRTATYELTIKERGFKPEPYAIADAIIRVDGKAIVAVTDMALQLTGASRDSLARLWSGFASITSGELRVPEEPTPAAAPAPLFDQAQILAFAVGKPSVAFGDRYQIFDQGRFIARLPGPPYQFLDRIMRVDAEPWIMAIGGTAEAQFDVLPDAWYFDADRQDRMPFGVLLEFPLQACGWMAAYMGSALTNDGELRFRNLGGTARQYLAVNRQTGTLTTRIRVTKISKTAGMILQHFEFSVFCRNGLVYEGHTEFGFFHPSALAEQVGIRDVALNPIGERANDSIKPFALPSCAPFPDSRWSMINQVDALSFTGGTHGLGFASGSTKVDPQAWFFKAHFLDDPVWPGSLGLESFLQLLKMMAATRWDINDSTVFESPSINKEHRWTYRGQIVPSNKRVTVQAEVKVCDERDRLLVADGYLGVDGKVIYRMNDFSIRLASD